MKSVRLVAASAALFLLGAAPAYAALPFAEDFNGGTSNWRFSNSIDLTAVGAGGPDGSGYVSRSFSFSTITNQMADIAVVFRGQASYGSSGGAYIGDWAAQGADLVTAYVRHSAPEPLVFNVRLANANNHPGASYYTATPVAPNVWTPISFDITVSSPQHADDTYEGTSWNSVYSNVGNIQFGVNIPPSLVGSTTPYTFDLDKVGVFIPEPCAGLLATIGVIGLVHRCRRRR